MAKMFYTTEEAASRLGITAEQLKQFIADNKLREFRDGARVMFKVDQVDRLATDAKGKPNAGAADSGIALAPTESGSHDAISLADTDAARAGTAKDDTVVTGGAGKAGGTKSPLFDPGEVKAADSAAQTQIQPAVEDQLSLEGVGSGSGLLDLTRESDDTSLGAELLDEIYPGGEGKEGGGGSASGIFEQPVTAEASGPSGLDHISAESAAAAAPTVVEEARDPSSGAFGGMALAGFLILGLCLLVLGANAAGFWPGWVLAVAAETMNLVIFGVIMVVVSLLFAGVGFFIGKATGGR